MNPRIDTYNTQIGTQVQTWIRKKRVQYANFKNLEYKYGYGIFRNIDRNLIRNLFKAEYLSYLKLGLNCGEAR